MRAPYLLGLTEMETVFLFYAAMTLALLVLQLRDYLEGRDRVA